MSPQTIPLNDAAVAMLGMCDNDCGRPAVSGFGRGLYKHCSRACERANVVTFDRETVLQLRQESDAALTKAAKESAKDVAALEAIEEEHGGKGRVKIARIPVVETVAPPRKLPEYSGGRRGQGAEFVLKRFPDDPKVCRREGCDRKVYSRDLCQTCNRTARRRGILETLGLPAAAPSRDGSRTNEIQDKIEELARKKPGIHIDAATKELGISRRHCYRTVQALRRNKRLTRPKCHNHDPEYMRLYVVKP